MLLGEFLFVLLEHSELLCHLLLLGLPLLLLDGVVLLIVFLLVFKLKYLFTELFYFL